VPRGAVGFTALIRNDGKTTVTVAHPSICVPVGTKPGETRRFSDFHGKSEILLTIGRPDGATVALRDGFLHGFDPGNRRLLTIPPARRWDSTSDGSSRTREAGGIRTPRRRGLSCHRERTASASCSGTGFQRRPVRRSRRGKPARGRLDRRAGISRDLHGGEVGGTADAGYGIRSTFPVVFRPSSARWASAAFASGNSCSIRSLSEPSFTQPSTSPPQEKLVPARDVVKNRRPGQEDRPLLVQELGIEKADRAARLAEEHHHPARREGVEAPLEGGLANRVVDHVHAAAVRERLHRRDEVLPRVVDDEVGPDRPCEGRFLRRRDRADDARPRAFASWQRRRPTPPAAAWTRQVSPGLTGQVDVVR